MSQQSTFAARQILKGLGSESYVTPKHYERDLTAETEARSHDPHTATGLGTRGKAILASNDVSQRGAA